MIVHRGLLRMSWLQAMPATWFGILSLSVYALFWPELMTIRDAWPPRIVFVQCLLLAVLLGRFKSPTFAFLYSRGYSRDSLWGHMMLVSFLSIVVSWLPASLIVWTGLRSLLQDNLFQSRYFPLLAPFEIWAPFVWLGIALLLMPAFHYAWIRNAQSTRGEFGGYAISIGLLIALQMSFDMAFSVYGWLAWLSGFAYVVMWACLVIGGRILHRSLEVRA
jgi:hypothetical protein